MHSLKINVNNEAYEHLLYIIKNISDIQIVEDKNREEFLSRVKSSKEDIKEDRVSNFNFDEFLE